LLDHAFDDDAGDHDDPIILGPFVGSLHEFESSIVGTTVWASAFLLQRLEGDRRRLT